MSARTCRIIRLVAAVFLVGLLGGAIVACGSDPWSGTWKATTSIGQTTQADGSEGAYHPTFVIAKGGDGWTITDDSGTSKACKIVGDRLVITEFPEDGWAELRNGRLVMVDADGRVVLEFAKE